MDTTRERDDLEHQVLEWTERTYRWKSRAEEAERKLTSAAVDNGNSIHSNANSASDDNIRQDTMLLAAIEKSNNNNNGNGNGRQNGGRWSIFRRKSDTNKLGELENSIAIAASAVSASDACEQKTIPSLESTISQLRSEMVQQSTAHKEEAYRIKKRIAHLEFENEALILKNATLEKISRFQEDH
eukprot:jgi/Psemu1/309048/fgenesh1_kg.470_\